MTHPLCGEGEIGGEVITLVVKGRGMLDQPVIA